MTVFSTNRKVAYGILPERKVLTKAFPMIIEHMWRFIVDPSDKTNLLIAGTEVSSKNEQKFNQFLLHIVWYTCTLGI